MERRISLCVLLCLVVSGVGALVVTIPQEEYEFARGDNITLPCKFTRKANVPGQASDAKGLVVISWSVEGLEADAKELLILTYYSIGNSVDIKKVYENRVSLDVDLPTGKADLRLSSITLADNKKFQCRVQIRGDDEGKPADTARLVVLVAPSPPICKIQGTAEYGKNINLTCVSEEGSPPPVYKWNGRDVRNMPRVPNPRDTDKGGILSLYNISKETSGYYTCTSSNKIRSASCNITLSVMPPSMNMGSTALIIGIVVGVLILLAIIIFCCCRHRKKKREEQYAMGVRGEEFQDKEAAGNGESHRANKQIDDDEESSVRNASDRRDRQDERGERDYSPRRDYDDRESEYNDRRSEYDDRRSDYDDRRSDYSDRREKYSDRHERYDDDRRYDDERRSDRRYDDADDRYDDRYDDRDRPPVPSNKPRRDYDD